MKFCNDNKVHNNIECERKMEQIAKCLVNKWYEKGYITDDEKEWCLYGLLKRLTTIPTALIIFILGCMISTWDNTLLFLFCVIILRRYSNGYHAKTFTACFCMTTTITMASLVAVEYLNEKLAVTLLLISAVILAKYAPINSGNLHLNDAEIKAMKRRNHINLLLLCMIDVALFAINRVKANCVVMAFAVVACLLIAGFTNRKGEQKYEK